MLILKPFLPSAKTIHPLLCDTWYFSSEVGHFTALLANLGKNLFPEKFHYDSLPLSRAQVLLFKQLAQSCQQHV